MNAADDLDSRLDRANPCRSGAGVSGTDWSIRLLSAITADDGPSACVATARPRRIGRRGMLLALTAALLLGGGAGLATIAMQREAPAPTQAAVRQALDLPSPERPALRPLPGGIREAFRAETPYGTWVINTIETRGKGVLVTGGVLRPDGTLDGSGIGGCPPSLLGGSRAIATCGGATDALGTDHPPVAEIHGRASDHVAAVELRLPDGDVVTGYADGGFFLVLLDESPAPAGDFLLTAKDASGEIVGRQTLTSPDPGRPPMPRS